MAEKSRQLERSKKRKGRKGRREGEEGDGRTPKCLLAMVRCCSLPTNTLPVGAKATTAIALATCTGKAARSRVAMNSLPPVSCPPTKLFPTWLKLTMA